MPALLLGLPGATPGQVLATNKLSSIAGTSAAAATYWRRQKLDWRPAALMAAAAFAGSVGGAFMGLRIPKDASTPIILILLVLVGGYTLLRPSLGDSTDLHYSGVRHSVGAMAIGCVIGGYDGALGCRQRLHRSTELRAARLVVAT